MTLHWAMSSTPFSKAFNLAPIRPKQTRQIGCPTITIIGVGRLKVCLPSDQYGNKFSFQQYVSLRI
ncbi:MAG: hypothetical protein MI922_17455, partial [Bacteroidales bacterium]|nr:hypothetical protein [Bacteroidales bacterium]